LPPSIHGSGGAIGLWRRGAWKVEQVAAARAEAEREKRLEQDGLRWAHWRESGTWIGIAFGTPCSDGERVYVVTGQACVFAFALDGTPVWQQRILTPAWDELDAAHRERLGPAVQKGWKAGQLALEYATSPTLCHLDAAGEQTVLLVNAGRMLRAFDAAAGRLRWAMPLAYTMKHSSGVPRVVRIDGEPVVASVSGGIYRGAPKENNGDDLVRVRDGVVVGNLPAGAHGKGGGTGIIPLGDGRAVVALEARIVTEGIRSDPSRLGAMAFAWELGRRSLANTVVWEISAGRDQPVFTQPAVCDGVLHFAKGQMELASGAIRSMPWRSVHQGYHDDGVLVAGKLLLKWNRYGQEHHKSPAFGADHQARFHFFDRTTGEPRGTGTLPINPADGAETLRRHQEEHDKSFWRWLGAAPPVVAHRRLYVRSYDFLWCIGDKSQ
jgi:hypothetical protein